MIGLKEVSSAPNDLLIGRRCREREKGFDRDRCRRPLKERSANGSEGITLRWCQIELPLKERALGEREGEERSGQHQELTRCARKLPLTSRRKIHNRLCLEREREEP